MHVWPPRSPSFPIFHSPPKTRRVLLSNASASHFGYPGLAVHLTATALQCRYKSQFGRATLLRQLLDLGPNWHIGHCAGRASWLGQLGLATIHMLGLGTPPSYFLQG